MFLSMLARLTKESFEPLVLTTLTLPSTEILTDFDKSRESVPIPVHTPPSQGPTSFPTEPFSTFIFKLLPAFIKFAVVP